MSRQTSYGLVIRRALSYGVGMIFAVLCMPVAAQSLTVVPAGCGCLTGKSLIGGGWTVDDHSGDSVPLGTAAAPHRVKAIVSLITIGTRFDDYIIGNNVNEIICGGDGKDHIEGQGGDDWLSGGPKADTIYGQFGKNLICGDDGPDDLFGDDPTCSNTNLNFEDTIFGGDKNDMLVGCNEDDMLDGEAGNDLADGGSGTDTCVSAKTLISCP